MTTSASFGHATQSSVEEFQRRVAEDVERLKQMHLKRLPAPRLVTARVQSVNDILNDVWSLFMSDLSDGSSISLVAVGGYGREELNPYSDIDILLLLDNRNDAVVQRKIEPLIRFLWDIGFEVGHSVRTLSDCVKQSRSDITVMTNLLEARHCAGSNKLFVQMESMLRNTKIWPARKFFEAKLQEQKLRHHKYADTVYNLEPNIKEGPGGLRDIHTIIWVAMRHFESRGMRELVTRGFLKEDEYRSLIRGRNYLWKLRNELHLTLGRREDRLLFSHQLELAKNFGYLDDDNNKAVEKLMKIYFRTVKELRHINQMLLQHFDEAILAYKRQKTKVLNDRFQTVDGYLDFTNPALIESMPEMLVEACTIFQLNPNLRGVRAKALRLMRSRKLLIDRNVRSKPAIQSMLLGIFSNSNRLPQTLSLMDDTGILGKLIPDFRRITGQLQYDLFHVYTVDAHLLNVVHHLHQLILPDTAKSYPLASEAVTRIIKPERLFIAGLFHDIAKGQGGDHSELGEQQCYRFCKRIGMSDYDAHFVAWLVRNHLYMSFTSQREDLNDSQVISKFAVRVGNQEHLDHLFLLTIADMRGTGPTVWNDWKGKMLEHLYLATSRTLLTDTLPHEELEPRIEEIKSDSLSNFGRNQSLKEAAKKFWGYFDDHYFLSYDANTIAWHVEKSAQINAINLPLVCFRAHPSIDVIQTFVLSAHSEDLFTIIAGALDRCYLNVLEARTHRLPTGLTAFSFVVLLRNLQDAHTESSLRRFEEEVQNSILSRIIEHSPRTVAPNRVARHISFPTRIEFSHSSGGDYTMMEISAQDRPGLLYLVVRTLLNHKIRLLSAKITTTGARVEDVFFVVDRDRNRLADKAVQQALTDEIREALDLR